jgi:hypothetical protein
VPIPAAYPELLARVVEFQIVKVSIFEVPAPYTSANPIPEPSDRLDALIVESAMVNELISDLPQRADPLPIPEPPDKPFASIFEGI